MRYRLRTLLIFLAIAPPLLAAAWLVVIRPYFPSKRDSARAQVNLLSDAVNLYLLSVGDLPPTLDAVLIPPIGLRNPQRWSGPYLETATLPMDPWNHSFRLEVDRPNLTFRIRSNGPDGVPRTTDDIIGDKITE
jgi:general secretion pathway protein G